MQHSRQIKFESIHNFRDLGGYKTHEGYSVNWRRIFRSAEPGSMTENDLKKLRQKLGLTSVIDLRSNFELEHQSMGLLSDLGIKYFNVSLVPYGGEKEANQRRFKGFSNMGEWYVTLVQQKEFNQRVIEALEIIAECENHPLLFYCSAGKDRTGVLAAIFLSVLGVADEDIVNDYCLSASYMKVLKESQTDQDIKGLPDYHYKVDPESISMFLARFKQDYGSTRQYIEAQGAESSLINNLKRNLLT